MHQAVKAGRRRRLPALAVIAALGVTMMGSGAVPAAGSTHPSVATAAPSAQATSSAVKKPRIIAMEDAEVDDMDSVIRLLYYSNEFNIAGIVATSSEFHYKGNLSTGGTVAPFRWTGVEWVDRYIDLYNQIRPNLVKQAKGWPTADYLRSVYKIGNIDTEGDTSHATEGSDYIKSLILDNDPEPLYALAWGGTNTLARALQDIQTQYQNTDQWASIQAKVNSKLIVYNILTQDNTLKGYIEPNWPGVKVIDNGGQFWGFAYAWNFVTPPPLKQYFQAPYMTANFLTNSGPLMEQEYRTYGDGNPTPGDDQNTRYDPAQIGSNSIHDFISEGDSPSFMFLLGFNGLNPTYNPTYGGWGGRFTPNTNGWKDIGDADPYSSNPFAADTYAQLRWLDAIQNDFAARVKWGVTPTYAGANHVPTASVKEGLALNTTAGAPVTLHASASDPDGNNLTFKWWEYTDADSYAGTTPITVTGADTLTPSFTIPTDAKPGDTIHMILQVTDNGTPALTYYQRVVFTVVAAPTVSFSTPASGASVSGAVPVTVNVGGAQLSRYQLTVDGRVVQQARPQVGEQTYTLDTTRLTNGNHTLVATVTNTVGGTTTASENIVVNNAPTAAFLVPSKGSTVSKSVDVRVRINGQGLTGYSLSIDSTRVRYVYQPQPGVQSFRWATTGFSNGEHMLTAVITDDAGNTTTVTQAVTVQN